MPLLCLHRQMSHTSCMQSQISAVDRCHSCCVYVNPELYIHQICELAGSAALMTIGLLMRLQSVREQSMLHRMPILDCGSLGSSLRLHWLLAPSSHSWSSSSPSRATLGATLLGLPSPWGEALWHSSSPQDCEGPCQQALSAGQRMCSRLLPPHKLFQDMCISRQMDNSRGPLRSCYRALSAAHEESCVAAAVLTQQAEAGG